jgi:cyclopropane fatty-acyl-phospholipid synthase-like methyltransferase
MRTKTVNNNDIYYKDTLWWFNQSNEDSYSIFNLGSLYDENYFSSEHLKKEVCEQIVDIAKNTFKKNTSEELNTVLECGSGGGWMTEAFIKKGLNIQGIEGSPFGYKKCIEKGIDCVINHDLRTPINLNQKFDMVISTEVAEHIEPPFVGIYVKNLIDHSDLIWFSFNSKDAHSNHHNCMPEKYWVNVFGFYGFNYFSADTKYKSILNHRLDGFFYNPNTFSNFKMD